MIVNYFYLKWQDGHLYISCTTMLCTCYWSHFTRDIEYHNMAIANFKQIRRIEIIMVQTTFQSFKKSLWWAFVLVEKNLCYKKFGQYIYIYNQILFQ
jgi:hypothetical protein